MDLRQLRYFVHAAQTQNLTHASGKAWISQSALSRQIKLLETELGVRLFERQARGLRLTEPGALLLHRAQALLNEADEVKRVVAASHQEPTGRLRIGAPTSLRSLVTAPFVARYHGLHSRVQMVLHEGTSTGMRNALADGALDVAIVSDQEALAPFAVWPLLSEPLVWVGPKQAQLRMDKPVAARSVLDHPLILTSSPNSLRSIVDEALAKQGLQAQARFEADSAAMSVSLIERGLGYTVLPFSGVHEALERGQVSASPLRGLRIQWVVARSRERAQTVAAERAVAMLAALCSEAVAQEAWRCAKLAAAPRR
jgi:LysR family transcriptional regulator, nitrogen assimilation regulatory protein